MCIVIDVDIVVHWAEREFIGVVAAAPIRTVTTRTTMMIETDTIWIDVKETDENAPDTAIGAKELHQNRVTTVMQSEWNFYFNFRSHFSTNFCISGDISEQVNYRNQKPSNKIIVLGLAKHLTEADVSKNRFANRTVSILFDNFVQWRKYSLQINADLHMCGIQPQSIRLIRKRKTGSYYIQLLVYI